MTKLEQAARQALEAGENAESVIASINASKHHKIIKDDEPCYWQREEWVKWALEEVLPQVTKSLAALREALAEQAEQEPVACEQCEELSADKARWYRMADMFAQQAQELKGVLRQALNLIEGEWPEGDEVAQPIVDKIKKLVGERSDR